MTYPFYKICSNCSQKYGLDHPKDNGLCPLCSRQTQKRKNECVRRIWERHHGQHRITTNKEQIGNSENLKGQISDVVTNPSADINNHGVKK